MVVFTSGIHGKDVIIAERIVYTTGSMNCSSNRSRLEKIYRIDVPIARKSASTQFKPDISRPRQGERTALRKLVPSVLRHFGWLTSATYANGSQPLKIGCTNKDCPGYLRPIDERAPFSEIPRWSVDRKTKYRLAERGKGKVWLCPKHLVSAKSSKRIGRTYCALYATTSPAVI